MFLWGVSTAAHQYEGNNINADLWAVEHLKGTPFPEPSGDACNGYHLYPPDIALVKSLGLNSFRFSTERARVEPEEGAFPLAELDFYRRVLSLSQEHGLTPNVTLNHFTFPRWFAARGAWDDPEAPNLFARYAERVGKHMGDLIGMAMPFNEPNALLVAAWLPGGPGTPGAAAAKELQYGGLSGALKPLMEVAAHRVGSNRFSSFSDPAVMTPAMIKAHHLARAALKAGPGRYPVGAILSMNDDHVLPGCEELHRRKFAEVFEPWLAVANESDFLGVQCYSCGWLDPNGPVAPPPTALITKSGWAFDPERLVAMLRYAGSQVKVPIYVTEKGISTDDDALRVRHIQRTVASMHAATADGVEVRGYFHRTLVDNWAWTDGFRQTLGLMQSDRANFARKPKPSAYVYGRIARAAANSLLPSKGDRNLAGRSESREAHVPSANPVGETHAGSFADTGQEPCRTRRKPLALLARFSLAVSCILDYRAYWRNLMSRAA